jgi:hypothetical protein
VIEATSSSEWPSTSFRITALRWSAGSRMKVRRLIAATSWFRSGESGAAIMSRVISFCIVGARATAKEIERGVMGDSKQPAFGVVDDTDHRQGV